jgi:phosphopantothenate-cysteine ligase
VTDDRRPTTGFPTIVVTGGGTVAPIDDVRQITNVSSGRFSARIAEACLARGATVWHIHARSAQLPFVRSAVFDLDAADPREELDRLARLRRDWEAVRGRLHLVPLRRGTVADYRQQLSRVLREQRIDVVILAMAVSDYEPEAVEGKLDSRAETVEVVLRRTPKVISEVRGWSPGAYLVGFKLLSRSTEARLIAAAEAVQASSDADLIVANDLQTYAAGRHVVHLVRRGHPPETIGPDVPVAEQLVDRVLAWARQPRVASGPAPT